jgi:hypothetical protein
VQRFALTVTRNINANRTLTQLLDEFRTNVRPSDASQTRVIAAGPTGATRSATPRRTTTTLNHELAAGNLVVVAGVASPATTASGRSSRRRLATTFTAQLPVAGLAASGGGTVTTRPGAELQNLSHRKEIRRCQPTHIFVTAAEAARSRCRRARAARRARRSCACSLPGKVYRVSEPTYTRRRHPRGDLIMCNVGGTKVTELEQAAAGARRSRGRRDRRARRRRAEAGRSRDHRSPTRGRLPERTPLDHEKG